MAVDVIKRTGLWKQAFDSKLDGLDLKRKELEDALLGFRDRTAILLTFISHDMADYTVHDINHTDALWETAQIIAGENYPLNPAECFVFGGAVLLHDAGMTLAAYTGGIDEIKSTPEWKSNLTSASSTAEGPLDFLEGHPMIKAVITQTLRDLHAKKAEALAMQAWKTPGSTDQEYLLEPSELRSFYGESIGQIAASHHWDAQQVAKRLSVPLGALPGCPAMWTVDRVKVALLLRCADAVNIDRGRAPRLIFALTQPKGLALQHWNFQSKLAKPQFSSGKLIYTSSAAFDVPHADAWQLAWDTIRMVDKELAESDEILKQKHLPPFQATGVEGARSPLEFAKYVEVRGWKPVLPEIRVSDVAHLARTLGGRDLYSFEFSPLRELIQNAADAIDARVKLDPEFSNEDGKISIKFSKDTADLSTFLIVEDNGLGMSERVLTGPLIDFGNSFWKSSLAKAEYPELQSTSHDPRGRYGIGFFSVFMWSSEVTISSRPFSAARSDTKVLRFRNGLGQRPILQDASEVEALGKVSTRVMLKLSPKASEGFFNLTPRIRHLRDYEAMLFHREMESQRATSSWTKLVSRLSALLEIKVYALEDGREVLANLPDWRSTSSERFVAFLLDICPDSNINSGAVNRLAEQLSFVRSEGEVVGRALLPRSDDDIGKSDGLLIYEKGIYISTGGILYQRSLSKGFFGAIEGRTQRANREEALFNAPSFDQDWASEQQRRIFLSADHIGEKLAAQQALVHIGRYNDAEPIFILNRNIVSFNLTKERLHSIDRFEIRLDEEGQTRFTWKASEHISIITGRQVNAVRIYPLVNFHVNISEHDRFLDYIRTAHAPTSPLHAFSKIMQSLIEAMGTSPKITKQFSEKNSYSKDRYMHISVERIKGV